MAGATELPEVTQKWVANVTEYVAAMEAMLKATRDVAEEVIELQAEIDALHGKTIDIGLDNSAAQAVAAAAAINNLGDAEAKAARDSFDLYGVLETLAEAERLQSETAKMLEGDSHGLATALVNTATAADASGAAATRAYRPWFLFGNNWKTAIHWIVAGGAEFLAVTIPAAVALGAGLIVAAQGAQNAQEHFTALYGATEATANMFHTTVGDTLGLGHALQSAQNAANPGVYEILGSALNDARTGFSSLAQVGLQVVHMWDEFSARITVDLKNGGAAQIGGLLSGMVKDLDQLGQVLGNTGHALLNFAAAMPGLVHILLDVVDDISKLILWVSKIPAPIITAVMAIEEFYRWGGLLLGLFARITGASAAMNALAGGGGFITRFGAGLGVLVQRSGAAVSALGALMGRMSEVTGEGGKAAAAVKGFGDEMQTIGETTGPAVWAGLAIGVGAIAGMIIALSRMKTATEQWIASSQKAISEAKNMQVLSTIGSQMSQNSQRIAEMSHLVAANTQEFNKNALAARYLNDSYNQTSRAVTELNGNQVQMVHQTANVVTGAQTIAKAYGISVPAAMALADQAGVHLANNEIVLGKHANVAGQMIMNLVTGLKAMGQPAGAVGNDMTALAIQSGLATTKVAGLNQAWDQFMQNLTGGTSGLSSFVTSLQNIGTGVAHVTNNLGQGGAFHQGMQQFANDLRNFGKNGAQAWQNFDQVVGSTAPQLIDWLRTAGAEGVIGGHQFQQGILDMVSSLVPLASHSKTAQAEVLGLVQQAGLGIHTWPQLTAAIKDNGSNTKDLGKIVGDATQKMSNMGQVAQNLGTVMQSAMTAAISNAALHTTGFYQDVAKLTAAIQKYGANSPQAVAAANAVTRAYDRANQIAVQGAKNTQHWQNVIDAMHGKNISITTSFFTVGHAPTGIFGGNPVDVTGRNPFQGQHGGVLPGYQPGRDSVHAMLSPGEGILNPYAVRMLGAGWVHAVNSMAERGGSFNPASLRTGGGGGGGGGSGNVMLKVYLDGKEMFGNNKVQVLNYNTRNSGGRTGKWIPS